jgi:4-nitrophenyl phosphatase
MDGVLWRGQVMLPGVAELFAHLRSAAVPFTLATNNASRTPASYVDRLGRAGVEVAPEQVLTSAVATADWLGAEYPAGASVYVVGGEGLRAAVAGAGFELVAGAGRPADVVVAGIDFDLTYDKLAAAVLHIGRGARFVGTNPDPTYPAEEGLKPGAGSVLAAIQAATGIPPVVIGKPAPRMFEVAVARMGAPAARTAMVGDRASTDIRGAQAAGLKAILVTTGVDDAASAAGQGVRPDAVFPDLVALREAWANAG